MPKPKAKRHWIVDAVDEETGEVDRGAVAEALADAEVIGYRMGDAVLMTPLREVVEFADGSERAVTRMVRFDVYGVPARKVKAADYGVDQPPPEEPPGIDEAVDDEEPGLDVAPEAEPDIPVEPEPVVEEA